MKVMSRGGREGREGQPVPTHDNVQEDELGETEESALVDAVIVIIGRGLTGMGMSGRGAVERRGGVGRRDDEGDAVFEVFGVTDRVGRGGVIFGGYARGGYFWTFWCPHLVGNASGSLFMTVAERGMCRNA